MNEKKSFLRIGGTIKHVEFIVRMGNHNLLVVFRFLVLLEQLRDAKFLREDSYVLDLVGEGTLGVFMLALLYHVLFTRQPYSETVFQRSDEHAQRRAEMRLRKQASSPRLPNHPGSNEFGNLAWEFLRSATYQVLATADCHDRHR